VWRNIVNSKFNSYKEGLAADPINVRKKKAIRQSIAKAKSEILDTVHSLSSHELNGW
jgi:hypothetical protein